MIIDLLDRYSLRGLSIDNSKNFKLAMPKVFTDKDFDLNLEFSSENEGPSSVSCTFCDVR